MDSTSTQTYKAPHNGNLERYTAYQLHYELAYLKQRIREVETLIETRKPELSKPARKRKKCSYIFSSTGKGCMSQAQYKSGLCKTHDRQRTERESTEIQRDHGNENRMDLGVIENVINGRWGEEEAHGDKERKTNDDYGNEIAIIESPNVAGTISVPTSEELGKLLTDFAILASTSASEPIAINQQQCQSLNEAGTISVPTSELGNLVTDFAILASEPIAIDKQLNPVAQCNAVGCQDTTEQEEVVKN
jgi:hypothetical protein